MILVIAKDDSLYECDIQVLCCKQFVYCPLLLR